jgi:hypothetical protein
MGFHHNLLEATAAPLVAIDEQMVYDIDPTTVGATVTYLKACNFKTFNVQHGGHVLSAPWVQAGADPGSVIYTYSKEVSFPLFSFLGALSNKFVPLHNGFTIQLTLNPLNRAMSFAKTTDGSTGGTFTTSAQTITDVNMCCQILELGPVAESMPGEVELRVGAVPGIGDAEVNLVWEPAWSPANMTDEARLELGML